jgi:competence protein ComFC
MAIELIGNWAKGLAYDVHTLSSTYLGPDQFGHDRWDSTYSEMGKLVYQLKYKQNKAVISKIVDLLTAKIKGIEEFDVIVPAPSSNKNRPFQPVDEIAKELGRRKRVKVINLLDKKAGGPELKNVDNPDEREKLLKSLIFLSSTYDVSGKKVLLLDDLYRSGATLSVATSILYEEAKVSSVTVLTMTKTRSRR